jgi:Leucine-rich repeat (LRR) protein
MYRPSFTAIACAFLAALTAAAEVTFPDPALEPFVRKALEQPEGPILARDLAKIEQLTIYLSEVRDLTGLEQCVNLVELNCQSNKVENIDILARMPQLRRLFLNSNAITDLAPVASLVNLEILTVGGNPIKTYQPIAGLSGLKHLSLGQPVAADLNALASLTGLEVLYVSRMELRDLEFVRNMTVLRSLEASGNEITSLEPLRELRNLNNLELDGNRISDISPLSKMAQLERIDLSHNAVASLEGFPPLANRAVARFYSNRITDIGPLVEACGYGTDINLELGQNPLTTDSFCRDIPLLIARNIKPVYRFDHDKSKVQPFPPLDRLCEAADLPATELLLSALNSGQDAPALREQLGLEAPPAAPEEVRFADANLEAAVRKAIEKPAGPLRPADVAGLERLSAGYEAIADLAGIEALTGLKTLFLAGNQIRDLAPVRALAQLENLMVSANVIEDLAPIAGLGRLGYLVVDDNQIRDLRPLEALPGLYRLSLDRNPITDLSPLSRITALSELSISGLGVTAIDFAAPLRQLSKFTAQKNQITSLEPLRESRSLIELNLAGNQIADLAPITGALHLYRLDLRDNQVASLAGIPPFRRDATLLLLGNRITHIEPLLAACGHGSKVTIELGRNALEGPAFCQVLPELAARGHEIVFEFDFPIEKATRFPELDFLCAAAARADGPEILAAANGGLSAPGIVARFGDTPREQPEALARVNAPPHGDAAGGTSATLATTLADTDFNVSVASTGLDLQSVLGGIVLLGVGVMLVIAWRLPRWR